jgi:hypothetical protein
MKTGDVVSIFFSPFGARSTYDFDLLVRVGRR